MKKSLYLCPHGEYENTWSLCFSGDKVALVANSVNVDSAIRGVLRAAEHLDGCYSIADVQEGLKDLRERIEMLDATGFKWRE